MYHAASVSKALLDQHFRLLPNKTHQSVVSHTFQSVSLVLLHVHCQPCTLDRKQSVSISQTFLPAKTTWTRGRSLLTGCESERPSKAGKETRTQSLVKGKPSIDDMKVVGSLPLSFISRNSAVGGELRIGPKGVWLVPC